MYLRDIEVPRELRPPRRPVCLKTQTGRAELVLDRLQLLLDRLDRLLRRAQPLPLSDLHYQRRAFTVPHDTEFDGAADRSLADQPGEVLVAVHALPAVGHDEVALAQAGALGGTVSSDTADLDPVCLDQADLARGFVVDIHHSNADVAGRSESEVAVNAGRRSGGRCAREGGANDQGLPNLRMHDDSSCHTMASSGSS